MTTENLPPRLEIELRRIEEWFDEHGEPLF